MSNVIFYGGSIENGFTCVHMLVKWKSIGHFSGCCISYDLFFTVIFGFGFGCSIDVVFYMGTLDMHTYRDVHICIWFAWKSIGHLYGFFNKRI